MNERENNYDLLRIIATFSVVLIHINAQFYSNKMNNPSMNCLYIGESFINTITRFAVPCFVMLSGAFILNKNEDIKKFYKKASYNVFLPFVLVSIFFFIFDYLYYGELVENIRLIIFGEYHTFWYMYMLLFIYIIAPYLRIIRNSINERTFLEMSIFMMIWGLVSQYLSGYHCTYTMGIVFAFLGYFMLGSSIYSIIKKHKKSILITMICFVFSFMMCLCSVYIKYKFYRNYEMNGYYNAFSPFIMLSSISTFVGFGMLDVKKNYYKLSKLTYFIYLFQSFVYEIIFDLNVKIINNEIVEVIIISCITFVISIVLALIFKYIWDSCTKKFSLYEKWKNMRVWKNNKNE